MNIGIDARPLVTKKTGFGFFLENMLDAILTVDKQDNFFFFSDREVVYDISDKPNVKIIQYKDNILFPKSFYYYYRLPQFIRKQGIELDAFWGTTHFIPEGFDESVRKVLTIHDFTHLKFPEATTKYNLLIFRLFFKSSIKNSDEIVCISKSTESELKKYYPEASKGKVIRTIYEGGYRTGECGSCDENNVRKDIKKSADTKYILFVGTIEPRKNIPLLIEAAPNLKGKAEVIICGRIGWEKKDIVDELYHTDNLSYFDYVSQDEKIYLMKHAFLQVQPSLYEGFGLPVVESMQAGTVVIVADNSSLSELIEKKELKFETRNADDFREKVENLIASPSLYNEAKEYCRKRGAEFSWDKAAEGYIDVFRSGREV